MPKFEIEINEVNEGSGCGKIIGWIVVIVFALMFFHALAKP